MSTILLQHHFSYCKGWSGAMPVEYNYIVVLLHPVDLCIVAVNTCPLFANSEYFCFIIGGGLFSTEVVELAGAGRWWRRHQRWQPHRSRGPSSTNRHNAWKRSPYGSTSSFPAYLDLVVLHRDLRTRKPKDRISVSQTEKYNLYLFQLLLYEYYWCY